MTLPAHPYLTLFRNAFRVDPADETTHRVCVDFLQDQGATLADAVLLFAGAPPSWVSEPWQEQVGWWQVLSLWCQWTEPKRVLPNDWLIVPARGLSCHFRFEAVRACELDYQGIADVANATRPWAGVGQPPPVTAREIEQAMRPGGKPYPHVADAINRVRREHKRWVLALFPDVKHHRLLRFDLPNSHAEMRRIMDEAEALLRAGGWRVDAGVTCTHDEDRKEIRYEQVLAAPDWIEPEPDPLSAFRRGPYIMGDAQVTYNGAPLGTARNIRVTTPSAG